MPNTFTKIASVTIGSSGPSSIDFTSIPSTYTDLQIVLSQRGTNAAAIESNFIRFNLDDTGSYDYTAILAQTGLSAQSATNQTYFLSYSLSGGTSTANTFGSMQIYIPNYAGSSNKSISLDAVAENNTTANDTFRLSLVSALWKKTAAINRVTIYTFSGSNFAQYTTATIYGIKNS